jgi:RNA polymerase sigma factor (sigma-70 family)
MAVLGMTAAALWTKHRPLAYTIAAAWYLPGHDQDDVQQEALIALWQAATTWDPEQAAFKTWAAIVIRRHLASCLRAATRSKQQILTQAARDVDAPYLHQVSERCETNEEIRALFVAINERLTDYERHLVLGVASGVPYGELDGNPKQVDNGLFRARTKLRAA